MPLQLRRGTDAERTAMTERLAPGEPLWITDQQKLYVGDGTTASASLPPVTGFNANDAKDAAAASIASGSHTGVSFAYNSTTKALSATVDLVTYTGNINASITADDSSLLVDAATGRIVGPVFANVTGNVTGNLTGNVSGNVTGNVTGNLTGNSTGYHTGDVKGSLVADDSTMLVDGVAARLVGSYNNGSISIVGDTITTPSVDGAFIKTTSYNLLDLVGITDGSINAPTLLISVSDGTLAAPTTTAAGDQLGGIKFQGYNGTAYKFASQFSSFWGSGATLTDDFPRSNLVLATGAGGSNYNQFTFNYTGVFNAPTVATTVYSVAGTALPSAATVGQGARAFVSDATVSTFATAYTGGGANKVPVYSDGTVWRIG